MFIKQIFSVLVYMTALIGAPLAIAHGGATGIVKERMDLMDDLKGAMKGLSAMFKGERPYDADAVRTAAVLIRDNSGEVITSLFPKEGAKGHTEAKPEIWQQWSRFEEMALRQQMISQGLIDAANNKESAAESDSMMAASMMGSSAMMGQRTAPTDDYASMPAADVFKALADNCSSCHTRFRVKK